MYKGGKQDDNKVKLEKKTKKNANLNDINVDNVGTI